MWEKNMCSALERCSGPRSNVSYVFERGPSTKKNKALKTAGWEKYAGRNHSELVCQ